jgi:catechol 2,3-dioxygenase-like lactoylglutathione lyase family enzyme
MINLHGLSHTGFEVEDLDRCERFYAEVLGAKVEWKRPGLMKLYVGNCGLSISEVKAGAKKQPVPYAVHWAFRANHERVLGYVEHIKSFGVEVDGPAGHGGEPENVSWFFADPDGHKLELEAHYPTPEEALAVVDAGEAERKRNLELYRGGQALDEYRASLASGSGGSGEGS